MQQNLQAQLSSYKQQHHRLTIMVRSEQAKNEELTSKLEQALKDIKLLEKELKDLKKSNKTKGEVK